MHLFLCYTPLHALIVRRVVESEKIKDFAVVYFCFDSNSKHQKYFSMLKEKSHYAIFKQLSHSMLADFMDVFSVASELKSCIGGGAYFGTGNIKHFHSRLLMLLLKVEKYFTFDDGSGNVSGDGYFYDKKDRYGVFFFFGFLAPRFLYSRVVNNIDVHYSIYDTRNVYFPVKKISLLNNPIKSERQSRGRIVLYLANAFTEDALMTQSEELYYDTEIIKRFSVDQVLLHPRSKKDQHFSSENVEVVRNGLIAEDYVISLLEQGFSVTVVGVYSTALLNLNSSLNLKRINIKVQIDKPVSCILNQMADSGVTIHEI